MSERTPLTAPDYSRSGEYPRNGPGRDTLRVEPPVTGTRRRLPELILGILLIAGCALAAVLLALSGRSRTPVVALAEDVQRGQVIEASDLTTVQLGTDGDVSYVREADAGTLVGQVALTDLTAGAMVTPDVVGEPLAVLDGGDAQVGLTVGVSQMPSLGLAPGDRVNIVVRAQAAGGSSEVVAQALVADIQWLERSSGQEDRWYVSLQASETQANLIAMAFAGESRVELVLLGEG